MLTTGTTIITITEEIDRSTAPEGRPALIGRKIYGGHHAEHC
jgi:hypothetical protein